MPILLCLCVTLHSMSYRHLINKIFFLIFLMTLLSRLPDFTVQISQVPTMSPPLALTQAPPLLSVSQARPSLPLNQARPGKFLIQPSGTGCLGPACSAPGAKGIYSICKQIHSCSLIKIITGYILEASDANIIFMWIMKTDQIAGMLRLIECSLGAHVGRYFSYVATQMYMCFVVYINYGSNARSFMNIVITCAEQEKCTNFQEIF